jgi:hypothetical protein
MEGTPLMTTHHTVWITTDSGCLDTEYCDLQVIPDEIVSHSADENGDHTIPVYASTNDVMYWAELPIRHDADTMDGLFTAAVNALTAGGWSLTDNTRWEPCGTGYIATVERTQ